MNNDIIVNSMQSISFYEAVVWIIFICGIIGGIAFGTKKIMGVIEKYRELSNKREGFISTLEEHSMAIVALQEADSDIYACVQEISSSISLINESLENMRDENKKNKIVEMRNTLLTLYERFYVNNESKTWDNMQAQSFWSIYDRYISCGGNTFVAKVIAPAMESLKVDKVWDPEEDHKKG